MEISAALWALVDREELLAFLVFILAHLQHYTCFAAISGIPGLASSLEGNL